MSRLPRIPLKGFLDVTYRCNNDCRHCWLRLAPDAPEASRELETAEIRRIVAEARALGCRRWTISGGEPMLRPDFEEIFAAVTEHGAPYTLITNGTLITPALARLLQRPGSKLIALYGATADVHDHITRTPGSFDAMRRGIACLKEAGTGFTVQVVPMKDNYHQYEEMVRMAGSWSPSWRIGAAWLYLSASGDPRKNEEIRAQRLGPREALGLDLPYPTDGDLAADEIETCRAGGSDGLYATCISRRTDFHVDPYGGMSFCCFVKDPALRVDLRHTSVADAWNRDIPAMADKVQPAASFRENCGTCELRDNCRWCPVYAYLEHGDHSARVDYLCGLAREAKAFKADWAATHRRDYAIAGLRVRVEADLPFAETTFLPKFELFRDRGPGAPDIVIRHHFSLPDLDGEDLGREIYRQPPWAVYRKGASWIYLGVYPEAADARVHRVIVASENHSRVRVYNPTPELFTAGGLDSLMLLASDQILLARVLPELGGAFIHAAGLNVGGRGLLFAGPSEAGKSTITRMLAAPRSAASGVRPGAEILCDDRMIIRKDGGGFLIHGTWSHGEIPVVSAGSAPLRGLCFLNQSPENRLERIEDPAKVLRLLLPRLVRPLVAGDWWDKVLALAGEIAGRVPSYTLYFDKSGRIVDVLEEVFE